MPVAADAAEIERLADYLHGALGQDSLFQATHGFHIDGISIRDRMTRTSEMSPAQVLVALIADDGADGPGAG